MIYLILFTVLASLVSVFFFVRCYQKGYFSDLEESKYLVFRDEGDNEGK